MAEYKPDEKSGKRKSLLNSTKNKAEEPFQDDLTLLSGRKRKSSFENKEQRSKFHVNDSQSRSGKIDRNTVQTDTDAVKQDSPASSELDKSEDLGLLGETCSLNSEDNQKLFENNRNDDSDDSVKDEDVTYDDFVFRQTNSVNVDSCVDSVVDQDSRSENEQSRISKNDVSGECNEDDSLNIEADGDMCEESESKDHQEPVITTVKKQRKKRTSSILRSLEPIHPEDPPLTSNSSSSFSQQFGENSNDGFDSGLPRYHSHRAAAMLAKSRLNSKGSAAPVTDGDNNSNNSSSNNVRTNSQSLSLQSEENTLDANDIGNTAESDTNATLMEDNNYINNNSNTYNSVGSSVRRRGGKGSNNNTNNSSSSGNDVTATLLQDVSNTTTTATVTAAIASKVSWVQCDKCTKWRSVSADINEDDLPDQWFCYMNTWDARYNSCDAPPENARSATAARNRLIAAAAARNELANRSHGNNNAGDEDDDDDDGSDPTATTTSSTAAADIVSNSPRRSRYSSSNNVDGSNNSNVVATPGTRRGGGGGRGAASNNNNAGSGGGRWRRSQAVAAVENDDIEDDQNNSNNNSSSSSSSSSYSRRRGGAASVAANANASSGIVVAAVNWVQCNKCHKWRKVPESIDVDALPEKWYCSLNTWYPAVARCSARQEVEEATVVVPFTTTGAGTGGGYGNGSRSSSRRLGGNYNNSNNYTAYGDPSAVLTTGPNGSTIKKVSWVQCERRNCKKWRKVPASIDIDSLPEKWFCEMNTWDADSATCDAPEASDSEDEQRGGNSNAAAAAAAARTQLILSNSKGPGALSYRRIIFGTDGRIRVCFSDKNKNGYGLFSHSEAHKPSNEIDDYTAPTRKVSYWWSSAFKDPCSSTMADNSTVTNAVSSANATALAQPQQSKASLKKQQQQQQTAVLETNVTAAVVVSSSSTGDGRGGGGVVSAANESTAVIVTTTAMLASASTLSSAVRKLVVPRCRHHHHHPLSPTHLLDAARRMHDMHPMPPGLCNWPRKLSKSWETLCNMTLLRRQYLECSVILSSFLAIPGRQMSFSKLYDIIANSHFSDVEVEACRLYMSIESMKWAIRKLESRGVIDVYYTSAGQQTVEVLQSVTQLAQNFVATKGTASALVAATGIHAAWVKQGLPLKLRKFFSNSRYKLDPSDMLAAKQSLTTAATISSAAITKTVKSTVTPAQHSSIMSNKIMKPFRLQHKERWNQREQQQS